MSHLLTKPKPGARLNPLHPLARGLVGFWLINEGSGSKVHDISGKENHGTLTNMSTNLQTSGWGGSKFSGGLGFDGTDDYTQITNSSSLNPLYISISAWIKTSASGVIEQICTKDCTDLGGCDPTKRVWQFRKYSSNVINFIPFSESSYGNEYGITNITDGVWHHVVGTWDGITVQVYVDGNVDGNGDSLSGTLRSDQTNDVFFGRSQTGDPGYFDGMIDLVRIYNHALSASEVKQLYENPFAGILPIPRNIYYSTAAAAGWTGTFLGVTNPSHILGVSVADILKVNGVESST